MSQNYKLVESVIASGDICVKHYVNEITGLRVVTAFFESPIVKGDFVLATEAFDDDGLPHTLEHLVFIGSEDYPYKGVLDLLANKCLADGTNAYTETDHTNYSLKTAGSEGFLKILPIYLEHILYPKLTDAAYLTEVHHINGDGEDAGVVYCEMKGRENSGESRAYLEMLKSLYPGKSGYKSETGGLCANLRDSTSNEKVRNFHKQYYHSRNLCVIVTGPVEAEQVFAAIKVVEDKIVEKKSHMIEFERPWQAPIEPLPKSVTRIVPFSSETDEEGLINVAWRGPNVFTNFEDTYTIALLLDYLNTTAVAPLQKEFVECAEPYCSCISYSMIENSVSAFYLSFESVGKEYLHKCLPKLFDILNDIYEKKIPFDMDRLKTIISRKIVQQLSIAESSPHTIVVGSIIGEFLYGNGNLKERCKGIEYLKALENKDESYWLSYLGKYFVGENSRYVCIVGEPSPELMKTEVRRETDRVNKQKEFYHDKLKEFSERLECADLLNNTQPPQDIIDTIETPSIETIKFHTIERNLTDFGNFRLQYDSIKTNFITIHILLNTSNVLTKYERMFLSIMSEMLLELPVIRSGDIVPYETIVNEIYSNTVTYGTGVGLYSSSYSAGSLSSLFSIAMQVEIDKYKMVVDLLSELVYQTVFDPERIKNVATRIISDIQVCRKSGSKVASCVINAATYQSNSNHWALNFMRQQKFLKKLLKDLKNNEQDVVNSFNSIRNKLTQPDNILVHLSLNKSKVDINNIEQPWKTFIPENILTTSKNRIIDLSSITKCCETVKMIEEPKSSIIGVGSIESNFMHQVRKSIDSFHDPDLAALYVLIQYLTQCEGPLYRQIRGLGLSYHQGISLSPADGLISFILWKSSQILEAYKKLIEQVDIHCDVGKLDENLLAAAKSSLIFELIKREKSALAKSSQSLIAWLRDTSIDFNKQLIAKISKITKQDLARVCPKYLKPLFEDMDSQRSVICCNTSKIDELIDGFSKLGRNFVKVKLDEEPFINSIE